MVFDIFSIAVFLLSVVIIFFIVRAVFVSKFIKVQGHQNYSSMEQQFKLETDKGKKISENIMLINAFGDSVIMKLFKITNELLLLQKAIFKKAD